MLIFHKHSPDGATLSYKLAVLGLWKNKRVKKRSALSPGECGYKRPQCGPRVEPLVRGSKGEAPCPLKYLRPGTSQASDGDVYNVEMARVFISTLPTAMMQSFPPPLPFFPYNGGPGYDPKNFL